MRIPDKLKIGGFNVVVKLKENLAIDHRHGGEYSPRDLIIYLDPVLEKRHGEILLHEIIEAICDAYDVEIDHHYIMIFGRALYQVLKDNDLRFGEA